MFFLSGISEFVLPYLVVTYFDMKCNIRKGVFRVNANCKIQISQWRDISSDQELRYTPQPLYNTIVGVHSLTLKTPRKSASENVICLCRLLNILANFSNLFLHTGKQCGP